MLKGVKLVLFDLDGVLIDSKKNMEISWHRVQNTFGVKKPFKDYYQYIGIPFKQILKKLLIFKNHNKISSVYNKESIHQIKKVKLYSNLNRTLKKLCFKKILIGIVTSKNKTRTLQILKFFKFIKMDVIIPPSKKLRGKPHPDQILEALRKTNINSSNAIYVGDTLVDYKAAKKSGVNFVFAEYGYGKKKKFYKYSIKNLSNLIKIIT